MAQASSDWNVRMMAGRTVSTTQLRQNPLRKRGRIPFRRYTNLAAVIHLLQTRDITLLNPATWDDRNDAYFMAEYKRLLQAKTVLALCFAESEETYHHWRVFSHGADGVCLEFDKQALLSAFDGQKQIRLGGVNYRQIRTLRARTEISVEELPFLKRLPYQDEKEFRIVYADKDATEEFRDFPIDLAWIRRITLSPWMSQALSRSVVKTLRAIPGCEKLQISRSTLVGNSEWQELTSRVR
jgi:hypothetical protein